VDAEVAAWLTDRVIESGSPEDVHSISTYLLERASELVIPWQHGLLVILPTSLENSWSCEWPRPAKINFIGTLGLAHTSVPRKAWNNSNQMTIGSLLKATQDPDPYVATTAAKVLFAITPTATDLQPAFGTEPQAAAAKAVAAHESVKKLSSGKDYFPRIVDVVESIKQWRSAP
jgi:hypothetical protein